MPFYTQNLDAINSEINSIMKISRAKCWCVTHFMAQVLSKCISVIQCAPKIPNYCHYFLVYQCKRTSSVAIPYYSFELFECYRPKHFLLIGMTCGKVIMACESIFSTFYHNVKKFVRQKSKQCGNKTPFLFSNIETNIFVSVISISVVLLEKSHHEMRATISIWHVQSLPSKSYRIENMGTPTGNPIKYRAREKHFICFIISRENVWFSIWACIKMRS